LALYVTFVLHSTVECRRFSRFTTISRSGDVYISCIVVFTRVRVSDSNLQYLQIRFYYFVVATKQSNKVQFTQESRKMLCTVHVTA